MSLHSAMAQATVAQQRAGYQQPTGFQPPPAYITVQAQTMFPRPALVGPPAPSKEPRKQEWPETVRAYVRRAFEATNEIDGISSEEIKTKLREVISYFAERDMLGQIDWSKYLLPQDIIISERANQRQNYENGYPGNPYYPGNSPSATNTYTVSLNSSKRKSQDMSGSGPTSPRSPTPPWNKTNLQDRVTFDNGHKGKRQKKNGIAKDSTSRFDQVDLERRKQRFQLDKSATKTTVPWDSPRLDSDLEVDTGPLVGTNESLLKSYFRLTAPPKPETVRPQRVLEATLELLTQKWKEERNYNFICNQFKSLRQDLTVQHIKNAFTVRVYERHARIALEKGDLGEYNQCQTQLKALYLLQLGGHPEEFLAYRILYIVYTCNKTDMNDLLAELTAADKAHPAVKNALEVRSSLALGNYHRFFKLYLACPNMGGYLIDMFIERERLHALANISRAYMRVALRFLTDELGFENDEECREFLKKYQADHLIEDMADEQAGTPLRVRIKEGAGLFEALKAQAFRVVDIKGQI